MLYNRFTEIVKYRFNTLVVWETETYLYTYPYNDLSHRVRRRSIGRDNRGIERVQEKQQDKNQKHARLTCV